MALYENESEVLSLVFNATDNDNENWFSKNRLLRSPWTDLHSELQNFFSLAGDLPTERVFYINKVKKKKENTIKHIRGSFPSWGERDNDDDDDDDDDNDDDIHSSQIVMSASEKYE